MMFSRFQLFKKYIHYYFSASNGKGHGVHSPFVFHFIKEVLPDKNNSAFDRIEKLRKKMLCSQEIITVEDFGAGSSVLKNHNRKIKDIASSSLKQPKFARLLNRMISHYQKTSILELGTSLGITTAYLASVKGVSVVSMEGADAIANTALQNFNSLHLNNIHLVKGNFDTTLPVVLDELQPDFIFVDGNHRKIPTLNYFQLLLKNANENTIMVFDDIHWSNEMESAWECIKNEERVTLSIDLFFIGIIFFRKEFKVKQHFRIRF